LFKSYPIVRCLGLLGLALLVSPVEAQWGGLSERSLAQCVPADELMIRGQVDRDPSTPLSISALEVSSLPNAPVIANNRVVVTRGDQRLETESLSYDPVSGVIDLPVLSIYTDAFIAIQAQQARVNIEESQGEFEVVDYRIAGAQGSGHATHVAMLNERSAKLKTFDFTTCDPNDPDWQLIADDVSLDLERSVGTARGARLMFKNIPLFYLPWFSFPLSDERKSGFLYPRFGASSADGLDISIPYYWNLAPNYDATVTPRWIQDRGAMLGTEFRFLKPNQSGQAVLDVLPSDNKTASNRYFASVDYQSRLGEQWSMTARLSRVSDAQYFLDLGGGLDATAIQYMPSDVMIRGRGERWSMSIAGDFFQVLDDRIPTQSEPYRRLPRILFSIDRPLGQWLRLSADNELVYFQRDEGITGSRLDLYPSLSASHRQPGRFVRAEVGMRFTQYHLQDAPTDRPSRTTPILSLDAGLVFERSLHKGLAQTLEPRIHYLYVPYEDQSDLPLFDTAPLTFGFAELFHSNRFSGADRQGDANQLTLALSSRTVDQQSGRERFAVNLGQILYFSDRRVALPGEPVANSSQSAFIAEANWSPAQAMALRAGLQWDSNESDLGLGYAGLRYRGEAGLQGELVYRFRQDLLDQMDARFRYPLSERLNLIGRSVYSFQDQQSLELLAGIEYESCCWAVRLTAREYIRDRAAAKQTAVFFELHLKGLGSLGRQPYPLFR
jgi:LPS-assembly protein